jgi:phosphoribosylglycinamide formyltransferase-1
MPPRATASAPLPRTVVLISGSGSNLQALIDARRGGRLATELVGVVSNRPGVRGLERAARAGLATRVVNHREYPDRPAFDADLRAAIDAFAPDWLVLAGFMRVLTPGFIEHYAGRALNIHPALLPAFRGLDTHRRALAAGVPVHGASIHFVTAELDGGPVIAQAPVPVYPSDDAAALEARVRAVEHRLYPATLEAVVRGRVRWCEPDRICWDDRFLDRPLRLDHDLPDPAP